MVDAVRRTGSVLLSLPFPPLALALAGASRRMITINGSLWVAGIAVALALFAGPGGVLMLIASLQALLVVIRPSAGRRRIP